MVPSRAVRGSSRNLLRRRASSIAGGVLRSTHSRSSTLNRSTGVPAGNFVPMPGSRPRTAPPRRPTAQPRRRNPPSRRNRTEGNLADPFRHRHRGRSQDGGPDDQIARANAVAPVPKRLTIDITVHVVRERGDRHFSSRLALLVVSLRGSAYPLLLAGNLLADIRSEERR